MVLINGVRGAAAAVPALQSQSGYKDLSDLYQKAQNGGLILGDLEALDPAHPINLVYKEISAITGRSETEDHHFEQTYAVENPESFIQATQSVAFSAFNLLKQNQRNYIERRICIHSGMSPDENEAPSRAQELAKNDPQILLSGLADFEEFEQIITILGRWNIKDPSPGKYEAYKKIIAFLKNDSNCLSLQDLELNSLPNIFHFRILKAKLTSLDLSNNLLETLPAGIGELSHLKSLYLTKNSFTIFPEEIVKLKSLEFLELYCNQLTTLPDEIEGLVNLRDLILDYNRLITLPATIGGLVSLKNMGLVGNSLTIPPPEIGALENLNELHLSWMSTLTGLPPEIVRLRSTCQIYLESTRLSPAILERLRAATHVEGYAGPRFHFSMEGVETQREERPIEICLEELSILAGEASCSFPTLTTETEENQEDLGHLRIWLSRLTEIADLKTSDVAIKKGLAQKILNYLTLAEENEHYRVLFFATIEHASETCGDRVALSVLELGLRHKDMMIDPQNRVELATHLIRGIWAMQILGERAKLKVLSLPFVDEIEVFLAYPIKLKEELRLEIDIQEMMYFACSSVTQEELDLSRREVSEQLNDIEQAATFLISEEKWKESLKICSKNRWDAIEKTKNERLESAESPEDYERIGKEADEQLRYLTIEVLLGDEFNELFQGDPAK